MPKAMQPFHSLPYQRADIHDLSERLRRARLRVRLAMKKESMFRGIEEAQDALIDYQSRQTLAGIRHLQDTQDETYQTEQDFYDQANADILQSVQALYQAIASSRFQEAIRERYGPMMLAQARLLKETVQPVVLKELRRENKHASEYETFMAEASVRLGSRDYSLEQLSPLLESSDRDTRKTAFQARAHWLSRHEERLDAMFDDLVKVRHRIAGKLQHESFVDVGYRRMQRVDYDASDVQNLRQAIKRYIVPLTSEIRRLQQERLGLDRLLASDLPCLFLQGNPQPSVSLPDLPKVAVQVLSDLSGGQSGFFETMHQNGYIDWQARSHKSRGGFCDFLYQTRLPFIFMNGTGTADDVFTLMHEAGHAYAAVRSLPRMSFIDQHAPSLDACEVHSTALEYLAYPYMERFFGPSSEQVRLLHMTQTLLFLPYGCMIDEFQHRVYQRPDFCPDERHALWRDLEREYQPGLDYDGQMFFEKGGAWQLKGHVYTDPFYYIDYVLAQLVALDLWQTSRIDLKEAFSRYDRFCQAGGTLPFRTLLQNSGFASPFETDTIKRLAYAACDFLSL